MNQSTPLKRTSFTRKMPDNAIKPQPGKRKKKCGNKLCRQTFVPHRAFEKHCSPECGLILSQELVAKQKAKKEKAERAEDKKKLEKFKSRSDWMREAQTAFNKFIRERDKLAGNPCISSGDILLFDVIGGGFDAGHYRSIGSAPHLRFDERNVHAQSKHDNRYLSGNAVEYRKGLIERIGLNEVEALEADQTPRKFTIESLKEIIKIYKQKLKDLKNIEN